MGPLFAIIFWLILGIVWLGTLVILILAWKKGNKTLQWLIGIPFGLVSLLGLLLFGFIAWSLFLGNSPAYIFKFSFGFDLPAGVTDLEGEAGRFFDQAWTSLSFKAPTEVVEQILSKRFLLTSKAGFYQKLKESSASVNEWKIFDENSKFYTSSGPCGLGSTETAFLAWNPEDGSIRYSCEAID